MPVKRIFISIDISEAARAAVVSYIEKLYIDFVRIRVGWEHAEKLHFTIRFLGDTDEERLDKVCEIVRETANKFEPFSIRIAETGVFPHYKSAKVLWLGQKQGSDEMIAIKTKIDAGLNLIGIEPEKRKFHPHLTIARRLETPTYQEAVTMYAEKNFHASFEVKELLLLKREHRFDSCKQVNVFGLQP